MNPVPSIGRIVHYINLGDKDGKYPPEVQAAIITGVYRNDPAKVDKTRATSRIGVNNPDDLALITANKLGDLADVTFVDLHVLYRQGDFKMACVPFSQEPARGCWTWPPRV